MKTRLRPVDVHIGSRIRLRRMQANRTQEWLAGKLGLTFQQVQKYEKGINRVGGSRMQEIANALERPVGWFFEGAPGVSDAIGDPARDAALRDFVTSRDGLTIIESWTSLRPKMRAAFTRLVEEAAV